MCVFCWNLVTVYLLGLLQHVWCVFMPKCELGSEFAIRYRNWVFCSELVFAAEWGVLQRIVIRCRNWVVCSELAFPVEMCVLQRIWESLPKLSWLLWICNSLPKLSFLQRISIRCRIVCPTAKLWFAAETEMSVANYHSLPKCVFCSEFVIHCRSLVVCSGILIRCRTELSAAN
jgi:hypothetical protein